MKSNKDKPTFWEIQGITDVEFDGAVGHDVLRTLNGCDRHDGIKHRGRVGQGSVECRGRAVCDRRRDGGGSGAEQRNLAFIVVCLPAEYQGGDLSIDKLSATDLASRRRQVWHQKVGEACGWAHDVGCSGHKPTGRYDHLPVLH